MKNVLLAEHHLPTLEHVKFELTQAGFTVTPAADPGSALEAFAAHNPDAVVVALDFPRLEGGHLAQVIRAKDRGGRVPLVVIDKGHLGKSRGVSAILDLKANGYVPNPLRSSELVSKLESLLASAGRSGAASGGLMATLTRPPVARGEARGSPLPGLLHSWYRLRRDGVLVVAYRDLTRRVFLLAGQVVHYDSTARQDALANYLLERGEVTAAQADAVLAAQAAGMKIGAALAEAGVRLEGEELLLRLREFTRDKVAQVLGMREGRYAFYAGTEFASEIPTIETPTLSAILEGARRTFAIKTYAQALRPHLDSHPVRSAEFAADLPALGLSTRDLKVAMQINGRLKLRDLLAHGRGDLRVGYSLMWFLHLVGALTFSREPVQATQTSVYAEAERIVPRKRKPLPAETARELRDAALRIITGSYLRVLGLGIDADTEAVEKAYLEVAARFHPDTYAEYDLTEIQDLLDSVQDKIAASYRVLTSEDRRKQYLQYLLSRLDVGRSAAVNVDAEIALRRGEAALKRNDWISAHHAFEEAVTLNPREPEYCCYLAWATYRSGAGDAAERAKRAQRVIKKALALNPYLERGLIIAAIIDADVGEDAAARKKLLKVLELNPESKLAKAALRKVNRAG